MGSKTRTNSGGRLGYGVTAIVNAILVVLVNGWPGWEAVPFLTPDAASVVTIVNFSLVLGIVLNAIYIVRDPTWLKALGEVLTTAISLAVVVRTLRVFPFDFGDSAVDWGFWVRLGLWFLVLAIGIALIVQLARFLRIVARGSE